MDNLSFIFKDTLLAIPQVCNISFIFKRKSLRDATTQSISAKLVHINKEIAATDVRTDQDNYGVFSLSYNYINPDIIKEFRYNFSLEVAEKFSKEEISV